MYFHSPVRIKELDEETYWLIIEVIPFEVFVSKKDDPEGFKKIKAFLDSPTFIVY
ncbi:hypothetical protein [Priestia megaterium]|uniref:hypothetical protein n=1 Tax=Priestia megaterium TaxID=1404 RepID=UPI001BE74BB5|nr:hypothetical protein [Priestia megaterium]MBT2254441.1 hypothetical protein [Priestia megaterium]MBT2280496.1 hypothetical protein [Priestia megaterium]